MASSSKSKRATPKQQSDVMQQNRDWLELPSDVLANILCRIGVVDVLESAQRVCTAWRKICKEPAMWRVIHIDICYDGPIPTQALPDICKQAFERSQGQLVDFTIVGLLDDELLWYLADRSSQLKRLEIAFSDVDMDDSWTKALAKFPLLEELSLYSTTISKEAIETAGRCCPMLKTLKLNQERASWRVRSRSEYEYQMNPRIHNMKAMIIGENFPELTHLELIGSRMVNSGLKAILDDCLHLKSLDLRNCLHIDLKGDIGKRCSKQIKYLKLPNDSLEDYPYNHIKVSVWPDYSQVPFDDGGLDFEHFIE